MCAEISTKLMRSETVLDILRNLHQRERNWQNSFLGKVVGSTVLTSYNNNTYRVDDVDFNSNPRSTFETRQGPVSYMEYYRTVNKFVYSLLLFFRFYLKQF